jgi:hypothetical protein
MLSLPREVFMHLLQFTGRSCKDICENDIYYPERRDALQLYCTCKELGWLKDLYYTIYSPTEYEYDYRTVTLFGILNGPTYLLNDCDYNNYFKVHFIYYDNGWKLGNHCYIDMVTSNHAICIVNFVAYEYDEIAMFECADQVYTQWETIDPDTKTFVTEDVFGHRDERRKVMLVRDKVPENKYVIVPPEMEEADKCYQVFAK